MLNRWRVGFVFESASEKSFYRIRSQYSIARSVGRRWTAVAAKLVFREIMVFDNTNAQMRRLPVCQKDLTGIGIKCAHLEHPPLAWMPTSDLRFVYPHQPNKLCQVVDRTMADSDSIEQDSEPTPFITRALIGRFLAVGLFVALGTFAVIQSISGTKGDPHADHDHETVAELDVEDNDTDGMFTKAVIPSPSNIEKPTVVKPSVSFGQTNKVIKPSVVVKPAAKPAFSTNVIANNKVTRPPTGFSIGNQPKSPAAKPTLPPQTLRPTVVTPKPPERLAQANAGGFAPKIGSGGFGNDSSRRAATTIGDSVNSATKSAVEATSKSFGDLRSSVGSSAGALLSATKKTVTETANAGASTASDLTKKASTALSNPFGRVTSAPPQQPKPTAAQATALRPVQSSTSNAGGLRSFADRRTQELKPEVSTRSPFGEPSPAAKPRPRTDSPFANRSAVTATPPSRPVARKTPEKPASQPRSNPLGSSVNASLASRRSPASNSTSLNAQLASSVSARGMDTPGDRKLEGVQAPSLTIEKISPREIQVNQSADFEIKVRNVGRVVANDVVVVDRVPSGTEFIGASPEPTKLDRSGEVQWTVGTIEPGQEKRIRYQLRPTKPGEIGSVAHVLFSTQASMRTVVTRPVLDIVHSARPRVLIGDNVVFDVMVENKGDGPAVDVIVQEEVPDQLEYQEGFRQLEYEVGTLMPGQKRKIQLALRADKVGSFRNVVFASGKGGLEAKHEIEVEVIAPEIRVSSEGPTRRFLQRKATHRFTVENRGTAEANNVNLVARLPGGLRYVSSDNRGRYDSNSHAVYWKMPSLKDGVAGTVELTTLPVEVGNQDIAFEATADLRLTAETTQKMAVEHLVDVYFEIDDVVDPIEVGTDTTYRLRILNQGTKVASNVQLDVEFPRGLEPTSIDGDLRHQIRGQQVTFEPIGSLAPGKEVQLSIRAKGTAPGDHRVIASIRSDGREVEVSKEDTTRVYSDR